MQRVLENLEKTSQLSWMSKEFSRNTTIYKTYTYMYYIMIIIFQRRVLLVIFQIADSRLTTEIISGHKKSSALGVLQCSTILHN